MNTILIRGMIQLFLEKRLININPAEGREKAPDAPKSAQDVFKQIETAVKDLEQGKGEKEKLVDNLVQLLTHKSHLFSRVLLTALAQRTEIQIKWLVARNKNTPDKVFLKLLNDPKIRVDFIPRKYDPNNRLVHMVYDPDPNVRMAARSAVRGLVINMEEWTGHNYLYILLSPEEKIAWNEDTPPEKLTVLGNHVDFSVRGAVAANPKTPQNVLEKLANDNFSTVRANAALNSKIPKNTLVRLASDAAADVRVAVAENTNTPKDALIKLANDGDFNVKSRVAENPNAPPEALLILVRDAEKGIRMRAASHHNMPPDMLAAMANDPNDPDLQYSVVKNPSTPLSILTQLANDKKDSLVRDRARVALERRNEKK